LIDRDYYLAWTKEEKEAFEKAPLLAKKVNGVPIGEGDGVTLRYAVGQPMGALSSFNMLAVTHHFIIQLSYIRTLPLIEQNKIFLLKNGFK